jgi:hypothetical protein
MDFLNYFENFEFEHYWVNYQGYFKAEPMFYLNEAARQLKGDDKDILRKFILKSIIEKVNHYYKTSLEFNEMTESGTNDIEKC